MAVCDDSPKPLGRFHNASLGGLLKQPTVRNKLLDTLPCTQALQSFGEERTQSLSVDHELVGTIARKYIIEADFCTRIFENAHGEVELPKALEIVALENSDLMKIWLLLPMLVPNLKRKTFYSVSSSVVLGPVVVGPSSRMSDRGWEMSGPVVGVVGGMSNGLSPT
jgi:hypothetical protein